MTGTTSDALRFASISTIVAGVLGTIAYTIPMASEHLYFFISAPIATFLPSYVLWRLTFKHSKEYATSNIITVALLLTLLTHYLNFVVLGVGRLLCYYTTGGCTSYSGDIESLFGTLTYYSITRTLISLSYWGLLSWGLTILVGLYVKRTSKLHNSDL